MLVIIPTQAKVKPRWLVKTQTMGIKKHPRTDQYSRQSKVAIDKLKGILTFDPPGEMGAGHDWVLILGGKKVITQLAKN